MSISVYSDLAGLRDALRDWLRPPAFAGAGLALRLAGSFFRLRLRLRLASAFLAGLRLRLSLRAARRGDWLWLDARRELGLGLRLLDRAGDLERS